MEYGKLIAVTGMPGLFELVTSKTDGALVRLITPVDETEDVEDADRRLAEFTREIAPVLDIFIPGENASPPLRDAESVSLTF